MLETIKSPADIKNLTYKELDSLSVEIRNKITETVGKNGGHLASNLGIVEATLALHRVFDFSRDALIFDVGHQCYAHKLITGRADNFDTLRKGGGISGFVSCDESPYDSFTEGHSGTALSQALGMCAAFTKKNEDRYAVAVIGDGSFTNGMIYEALNSCKEHGHRLIIVLNDNEMSISKNVGGLSSHLTKIRTSNKYFRAKRRVKKSFARIPLIGRGLSNFARRTRDLVRRMLVSDNFFECMGIDYIGPVDGNDIERTEDVLREAKTKNICSIVHLYTKKGKGHEAAEDNPESFHSVSSGVLFEEKAAKKKTFSSVFGETMEALCEENSSVCAVTAAMGDGCGLASFSKKYPDNFYDVGIAEEHAVTFSAGLAKGGALPVTVMYSTFSQRVYDQLLHDVAIQHLPLTLCLDRAGLVGGDGITHQGIFDVSEFSSIPGIKIYSPDSFDELSQMLKRSIGEEGLKVIRYPKGKEWVYDREGFENYGDCLVKTFDGGDGANVVVVTYGRVTAVGAIAAEALSRRIDGKVSLVKLTKIFPADISSFEERLRGADLVYVLEEGIQSGGVGEALVCNMAQKGITTCVKLHAVNGFVRHGDLSELLEEYGFTEQAVEEELFHLVCRVVKREAEVENV